jgi:lipopolysaccharide transport system permease protein
MNVKTSEPTKRESFASSNEPKGDVAGSAILTGSARHAIPIIVVESEDSGLQLNLSDLWAYRELLYFLTWRDIKVRYKQTFMGIAWVVIQPLMIMLIFTLVFNKFARLDSGPLPYALFSYSGLLVWTFFAGAVSSGTTSLISNTSLVTKVYFPRVFIPAAAVGAGVIDLIVGSLLLAVLAFYYRVPITWGLFLVPVFVVLAAMLALGVGMMASALTVKYRDLRHALPFMLQFWMFASPVIYPTGMVPARWRWLLAVNPMTGILEGFRASVTGQAFDWRFVTISAIVAPLLLIAAYYVFRRLEDTFADVI